jgi:DeoR family transcriptional regulator, aga operon transcriptional repressor
MSRGSVTEVDRYTRWAALLDLLAQQERLSVEAAAEHLQVSHATVRRDFEALGRARKLVRLRGAAVHNAAPAVAGLLGDPLTPGAPPQARRIAGQAASLVHKGAVVGLAGSALVRQVARALGVRFEALSADPGQDDNGSRHAAPALTIVTNDVNVAADLARRSGLKVVLTGGVLSAGSMTVIGPLAGLLLQGISLDTVIVGATAVDPEFGVTAADERDAEGCALMISRARQVMVVATSADLNRSAFARICGTDRVDVLVTDTAVAPATAERFANRGVRVVTA